MKKKIIFFLSIIFFISFLPQPVLSSQNGENAENIADILEKKDTDELIEKIIQSTRKTRTVALKESIAVSKNFINLAEFFDGDPFSGVTVGLALKKGHNYFSQKDIFYLMQQNELSTEKINIEGKGISIQYYPTDTAKNYAQAWCFCYGKDTVVKKYILLPENLEGDKENKRILSNDISKYIGKKISIIEKSGPILIRRHAKLLSVQKGDSLSLAYQGKEKDDPSKINWNTIDF